jgi:hypothetical protein
MPRALLQHTVREQGGLIRKTVRVRVATRGTTTPISDPLYVADVGGTVFSNPLVANAEGEVLAWLDVPGPSTPGVVSLVYLDDWGQPTGRSVDVAIDIPSSGGGGGGGGDPTIYLLPELRADGTNSEVRYVTDVGSDANNGRSWGSAYLTIQKAIDDLPTAMENALSDGGGTVYFLGRFPLTASIVMKSGVRLIGMGTGRTTIIAPAGLPGIVFAQNGTEQTTKLWHLEGFRLQVTGGTSNLLKLVDTVFWSIEDVDFYGTSTGPLVLSRGARDGLFLRCRFQDNSLGKGVSFDQTAEVDHLESHLTITFKTCQFRNNLTNFHAVPKAGENVARGGVKFETCFFEAGDTSVDLRGVRHYVFDTCHWEGVPTTRYVLLTHRAGGGNSHCRGIVFDNCTFRDTWNNRFEGDIGTIVRNVRGPASASGTWEIVGGPAGSIAPEFSGIETAFEAINFDAAALPHIHQSPGVVALTDAASVATDAAQGSLFTLEATASRALAAPTFSRFKLAGAAAIPTGARITYKIRNASGGAITTTWDAAFKLAGAWVDAAAGFSRVITFFYDGANWLEESRIGADV